MELTEKNGHSSIEEILASVRRIIAEEPGISGPIIDLEAPSHHPRGDGLLDDPSDFDLPSIFRPQPAPANGKPAPLFGRLSDAIRGAASAPADVSEPSLSSLRLHRVEPAEESAAPHFLLSTFHETTAPRPGEIANSAMFEAPSFASAPPASPASPATPTVTAPVLASHSETPQPADQAPAAPQVPRQMAAFKDTRFRGMGSAPVMPMPMEPVVSPFEDAATKALVQAAAAPAETIVDRASEVVFGLDIAAQNSSGAEAAVEMMTNEAQATPAALTAAIVASYPSLSVSPAPCEPDQATEPPAIQVVAHVPPPVPVQDAIAQAPQHQEAVAPIEDSTADLLRPMLRQWLAENMPRMVEKALHIEVAESVKTAKK